jgi:hypothetical protein
MRMSDLESKQRARSWRTYDVMIFPKLQFPRSRLVICLAMKQANMKRITASLTSAMWRWTPSAWSGTKLELRWSIWDTSEGGPELGNEQKSAMTFLDCAIHLILRQCDARKPWHLGLMHPARGSPRRERKGVTRKLYRIAGLEDALFGADWRIKLGNWASRSSLAEGIVVWMHGLVNWVPNWRECGCFLTVELSHLFTPRLHAHRTDWIWNLHVWESTSQANYRFVKVPTDIDHFHFFIINPLRSISVILSSWLSWGLRALATSRMAYPGVCNPPPSGTRFHLPHIIYGEFRGGSACRRLC